MANKGTQAYGNKRDRLDWWLVVVLFIPVIYFLPELLGINVFAGIDTSRLNMPLRYMDRLAFASGHLPLWNPYMFAGFPQLAESESGVFYPGNMFIHFPGDFFSWYSVEVVAHFIIAAAGFYTWMRIRGHEKLTSAFLAATYATTPFLIFHITAFGLFTSIVWMPWYFVIYDLGLKSFHPVRTGLWLALFLAFMLMSGSPQAAFLGVFGLIFYALGKIISQPDPASRKAMFIRSLAVLIPSVIAPLIAAIQILPTLELTKYSERAAMDTIEFWRLGSWLTAERLISLVVFPALGNPADIQDYGSSLCFLGAVPFIFAAASIGMWKENYRFLFPLLLAGIIPLILAFGLNLPGYKIITEIPPFSMFRYPGRMAHIALTVFLPLAAPMIDSVFMRNSSGADENKSWWAWFLAGSVMVVFIGIFGFSQPGTVKMGSAPTFFFGVLAFLVALAINPSNKKIRSSRIIPVCAAILLSLSIIAQILLTYPFSRVLVQNRQKFDESLAFYDDLKSEFPTDQEIPRVLYGGSFALMDPDALSKLGFSAQTNIWDNMSGNASGLRGVTSLNGLTPLNQNDWKLIMRDTLQSRIDTVIQRSREFGEPKIPDDVSLKLFRILGADVLLLEGNDWAIPGYELWKDDLELPFHAGLCAYRAMDGLMPDAYFVETTQVIHPQYADFLRWLADSETDPAFDAAFVVDGQNAAGSQNHYSGESMLIKRTRDFNRIEFEVSVADKNAFFITGENYLPGWIAHIDGVPADIRKTNFLLSGILVPQGEHTIKMVYQPESVGLGMLGSMTGIIVWVLLMLAIAFIHRKGNPAFFPPVKENE